MLLKQYHVGYRGDSNYKYTKKQIIQPQFLVMMGHYLATSATKRHLQVRLKKRTTQT